MYKVTRDNIRTYEDKLSGNDDKLQQNPETTSWFVDKDDDDQEKGGRTWQPFVGGQKWP